MSKYMQIINCYKDNHKKAQEQLIETSLYKVLNKFATSDTVYFCLYRLSFMPDNCVVSCPAEVAQLLQYDGFTIQFHKVPCDLGDYEYYTATIPKQNKG